MLTLDIILRRGFIGPRWCCMCRQYSEDCLHLFILYPFSIEIWVGVATILGVPQINDAPSILECFWLWKFRAKVHRTLPLYVLWGFWHTRNALIFEGIRPMILNVAMDTVAYFMEVGPWTLKHSLWTIPYVNLTDIYPICFFDGASSKGTCGCDISLHLDPVVWYHSSWHGGWGDNCRSELIALWGDLKCSSWLGIDKLLIFGDSLVLIN